MRSRLAFMVATLSGLLAALFAPSVHAQTEDDLLTAARAFPPMPRESVDLLQRFTPPGLFTFGSGTPYNDLEYTLFDTDYMEGETNGFDTFMPVDPSEPFPGEGTVKLVRGVNNLDLEAAYSGPRGDRIVLGTADIDQPFFLKGPDGVDDDYAVIQNYDYAHGFIQLRGTPEDYRLRYFTPADGVATEGHYLFYTSDGGVDLVAFIWPCDVLGSTVSGNPPRDDQVLCNATKRLALDDGVTFRFATPYSQTPTIPEALLQFGTPGKEIVGGITADARGNVYVLGASDGSVGGTLTAENTIFVAQFTPEGARGWTAEVPVTNGTLLFDATTDADYLYAVGRTLGALPGFQNAGRWDAILLKIDLSTGAIVDTDQYGQPGLDGYGNVVLDGQGGLYVSGAGSSPGATGTDPDYLVAKYSAETLDATWRVTEPPAASGPVFVSEAWGGLSVAPAQDGRPARLLAGGWYMSAGGAAGFLSLYEAIDTGQPQRVATATLNAPGQEADWVLDNVIGPDGSLYAAGYTTGALGGAHRGDGDAYVVRFDADLTNPRYVQFGTAQSDMVRKLEQTPEGMLVAVGYTYGDAAGPNADPERRTGDVLVQTFDLDLAPQDAVQFGTAGEDRGYAAVRNGLLYVGGMTEAALAGPSSGSFDGYVAVLDPTDLSFQDADAVATESLPDQPGLALFPNPTSGTLTVTSGPAGIDAYAVVDLLGRTVRRGERLTDGAALDLSGLAPGLYVVQATVAGHLLSRPVVKH